MEMGRKGFRNFEMTVTTEMIKSKPNIIFVFADQMRRSSMGISGENVSTPNFDKFASQGMQFTRAVSNTPVCGPARATILSGMHTLTHGVVNNDIPLRTNIKTIANCLNDEGYKCGYIGKWHLYTADRGIFVPPGENRQGFDDYWASYNCNHEYFNSYYYLNDNPEPVWNEGYEPLIQTDLAVKYIKEKSSKEIPFCLFLSWGPPHCPYREVPEKYLSMYPPESIKLNENAALHADKSIIAGYYAHISALDDCFGEILNSIDQAGISDNTIVVFTSDHGDMLYSQDRGWKGKPWAESVNIPFFIRWSGKIPSGTVNNSPFGLVDVMPTLLSMIGGKIPDEVQGIDFGNVIIGKEDYARESILIDYPVCPKSFSYESWRGVLTKQYTYARFKENPWVLYDDINDPGQLNNLVGNESAKKILDMMENELEYWLKKTNDEFLSTEEICQVYSKDSIQGVVPFYENDKIRKGKEERRIKR